MSNTRVGIGFDVHQFQSGRKLMLGCVSFEDHVGLAGHSDADVVAHAVCDAMLGAAGLGDMGSHFPDSDAAWKGASGSHLLQASKKLINEAGWQVVNVDCSVITESPKLSSHRSEMERRIGEAIDAPVNVKASRAEGLGAIGRSEGIATYAVALLESL
jgi:2-C-methyl-D-erythritol 2,4-cyclodiphosphate synthase